MMSVEGIKVFSLRLEDLGRLIYVVSSSIELADNLWYCMNLYQIG